MAPTESELRLDAPLVELGETDVAAGFALSEEAGWNQTAEDWSMMIRLGRAFMRPFRRAADRDGLALLSAGFRLDQHGSRARTYRAAAARRILERTIAGCGSGPHPLLDATPRGAA
jgi:hypothetical protein